MKFETQKNGIRNKEYEVLNFDSRIVNLQYEVENSKSRMANSNNKIKNSKLER